MEFLRQNASAVFAVAGVLLGGVLTFAANWRLRKRDYDLRAWERLLDRRVAAHEDVIAIALQMRVVVALGELDTKGEVRAWPVADPLNTESHEGNRQAEAHE